MGERRYTDAEVREIFRLAVARDEQGHLREVAGGAGVPEGPTLAELEEIGREIGIAAALIREAAERAHSEGEPARRVTLLGLPIGVRRTVELGRAPTPHEWSILLGEIRDLFDARGREWGEGTQGWRNGNLNVVVEPTVDGYRLRMATRKSSARPLLLVGMGWAAIALLILLGIGGAPDPGGALLPALAGATVIGGTAANLVRWTTTRERQMDWLARRARTLLAQNPSGESLPT